MSDYYKITQGNDFAHFYEMLKIWGFADLGR